MEPTLMPVELVNALKEGAAGIGENHTLAHARTMTKDLIDAGVVKRLFVELGTDLQGRFDKALKVRDDGIEAIQEAIGTIPQLHKSRLPIEPILVDAIYYDGIPITCTDLDFYSFNLEWACLPQGIKVRNEHIAKMVMSTINAKEATEKSAVGCLLLNGASHFNSGPFPIQSFFKGLRWADLTKDPTAPPSSSK